MLIFQDMIFGDCYEIVQGEFLWNDVYCCCVLNIEVFWFYEIYRYEE